MRQGLVTENYSEDRRRLLTLALWVAGFAGALVAAIAGLSIPLAASLAARVFFVILLGQGLLVVGAVLMGLRASRAGQPGMKVAALASGLVLLISGLLLITTWIGLALPLAAILVLALALIPER